jgi:hypothetical protein
MSKQNPIPAEWRRAADETAKALSVARAVERRQYPEGNAPGGTLPALIIAAALARLAGAINEGREWIIDALNRK